MEADSDQAAVAHIMMKSARTAGAGTQMATIVTHATKIFELHGQTDKHRKGLMNAC